MQFAYALRAAAVAAGWHYHRRRRRRLAAVTHGLARAHASYLWMKKVEIWTRLGVTVKTSENRSTLCTPNNKLKSVPKDENINFAPLEPTGAARRAGQSKANQ